MHLHHQCRQQERCARLEEHVCVRKLLQSLRESTDTGYWCDACKHLKRDFRNQGISVFRSLGFGALSCPVSCWETADFRASFAPETITLFHAFISHLIAPHRHKTPKLLQLFSLPKCHCISSICLFSLSFVQMVHDTQDWIKSHGVQFSHSQASFLTED